MEPFLSDVFIDSGAHGLYTEQVIAKKHREGYNWYKGAEFRSYVDKYAEFIKKNQEAITVYANVDVIFNPELTWDTQMYLEEVHGLHPVPVIHWSTPKKWLIRYLEKGYPFIALGGLGQESVQNSWASWGDVMFDIICDTPDRTPVAKVHGFAMTSHSLMTRYPWWSVDSTTWLSFAMYGQIIMPPMKNGKWNYDVPFLIVRASDNASKKLKQVNHYAKNVVLRYLDEKGFVFGKSEKVGDQIVIIEEGVENSTNKRCTLNALYFMDLCEHLPKWPWAFRKKKGLLL